MGALPVSDHVSVEEYLSNPAYEHFEYVDGAPMELNLGGKPHAKIQTNCAYLLTGFFRKSPGGYAATELHCRLSIRGQQRFRLPDVAVVLNDESTEQRYLDRAPDLVVEIRSPDDSVAGLMRKMDEYFANGAKLGWLILPEEKSVVVLSEGKLVKTVVAGEEIDGGEVLPELKTPVDELFV